MKTVEVNVTVYGSVTVTVEDEATNEDILDAAEEQYAMVGMDLVDDHEIDPDGWFSYS